MGENLNLMQALYVTISSMAMVFLILLVISLNIYLKMKII